MSTAGTSAKQPPRARPSARSEDVYVGQTLRTLPLTAGPRPFAVVVAHTDTETASGWLFPDPVQDGADPLLKELGVQSQDRLKPCYITVPVKRLK